MHHGKPKRVEQHWWLHGKTINLSRTKHRIGDFTVHARYVTESACHILLFFWVVWFSLACRSRKKSVNFDNPMYKTESNTVSITEKPTSQEVSKQCGVSDGISTVTMSCLVQSMAPSVHSAACHLSVFCLWTVPILDSVGFRYCLPISKVQLCVLCQVLA